MFIRTKRVSDPFDDKAKARFRGVEDRSSGSEHDADPLFPCLIHDFLQISDNSFRGARDDVVSSDNDNDSRGDAGGDYNYASDNVKTISDLLDPSRRSEPFLVGLYADVVRAAAAAEEEEASVGPAYLRSVMTRLRESGYNAGLCKARWETNGSLTAGRYEYIDVIGKTERYIVDVGFGAEFEIARATKEYGELLAALPRVMVGRGEEVRHVVRVMAEGAKRSMGCREMHVPPWRKRRYMLAKWLGPYRRTVNEEAASPCARIAPKAKCVAVGFGIPMVSFGYKV